MATFALCPQLDRKLDQNLATTAIAATSQVQKENKQKLGQNLTDRHSWNCKIKTKAGNCEERGTTTSKALVNYCGLNIR